MIAPEKEVSVRPDAIVADLHDRILALVIQPDAMVTEAYVSRAYAVARPTARIAIDRLVTEGLLVREAHRSARVRKLDRDDINDLFISRAAIEAAAVEVLSSSATVPPAALEAHSDLCNLSPSDSYAASDIAFHQALVHGSGSTRLPRLHNLLMGEIQLGIAQVEAHRLRSLEEVASEHQAILDAIATGGADLAGRLTREHVLASRDSLVAHYASNDRR